MKKQFILYMILVVLIPNLMAQTKKELQKTDFYTGEIVIQNIQGVISLKKDQEPVFDFYADILNTGDKELDYSINFRGTEPVKAKTKANEKGRQVLKPMYQISGKQGAVRKIRIDLTPEINGKIPAKKTQSSNVKVEIPEDYVVIRANKPFKTEEEGWKQVIYFQQKDKYLTPLDFVYNINGMGVAITKSISPGEIRKGTVTVSLQVTNIGKKQLNELWVEDNFDPRDFSARGPEFTSYTGEINDSRMIWRKSIKTLEPGKSVVLKYTVTANYDVKDVSLDAATATMNGMLMGVSNKIKL